MRVSPLGVVEEPRFRTIHDLTFAAGPRVRSSVNTDSNFEQVPECMMGHVLSDIVSRVLFLRQLREASLEIDLFGCADGWPTVHINEAFIQVSVDPSGAVVFPYAVDGHVVNLRCQFVLGSALCVPPRITHKYRVSKRFCLESLCCGGGTRHGRPAGGWRGRRPAAARLRAGDRTRRLRRLFLSLCGTMSMMGCSWKGGFCRWATLNKGLQSLATDHFRLLHKRGPNEPQL